MSSGTRFQREWVYTGALNVVMGWLQLVASQTCCVPITWGIQPVINSLKSAKKYTSIKGLLFSEPKIITSPVDIFTCESFIVLTP